MATGPMKKATARGGTPDEKTQQMKFKTDKSSKGARPKGAKEA